MAPQQLTYAGGLSLLIGILAWPIATPAQGFCYMVNARGEVVNLDDLCGSDSAPSAPAPDGAAAARPTSPTRFTVVGPLNSATDSSTDNSTDSPTDSTPDSAPDGAMDNATGDASSPVTPPSGAEADAPATDQPSAAPAPSDRLAIPQRDIPVPQIEVPEIPRPVTGEAAP
jgi:hypothetical protein